MGKDYLFIAKTTEDIGKRTGDIREYIPKGSVIYVKKEFKKSYMGYWPCMATTLIVTVPKNKCKKLEDDL